jgi:DNA-binding GntR family transcriptional regulator
MLTEKIKELKFRPTVLAEQVSHILKDAILDGTLKGGDQLVEAELQRQFGVSKSPIREALRDLETKGLVVIKPRKGAFVKTVTRRDIEEMFPVRAALEGLAAREAYHRMNGDVLREMRQTVQKMEKAVKDSDVKTYWEYHYLFHEIFIDASGNEMLINILRTLRMHTIWYRFSYQYYKEDLHKSLAIHKKILSLFRKKDSDIWELENLVRNHCEAALGRFLGYLEEQRALGGDRLEI